MISLAEVEKLAALARIELSPDEREKLRKDMESILGYVEQVQKVSEAVERGKKADTLRNVMREDRSPHESGIFTETLLGAAPQREGQYVKVKKIL